MGYLFELAAELGPDASDVAGLATGFHDVTWTLSDGTVVPCYFHPGPRNPWRGPDQNWWCRITPKGVSATGATRNVNTSIMVAEVARHMYATLKQCSGFRFALVGWEVAESVEISELLAAQSLGSELLPGLVVSRDLWLQMGSPSSLIPFGIETFWKPLSEDDYRSLAKLFSDD